MLVKLQILATDINNSNYFDGEDCPITRAFNRAGLEGYQDCGVDVKTPSGDYIRPAGHQALVDRLTPMLCYNSAKKGKVLAEDAILVEPHDFEVELEIP